MKPLPRALPTAVVVLCCLPIGAPAADAPAPLEFEIVIVERDAAAGSRPALVALPANKILQQLDQADSDSASPTATRIRVLSSIGGSSQIQVGETRPIATGRAGQPRRGDDFVSGNTIYHREDFGTLVQVQPELSADGQILVRLRIERSVPWTPPEGDSEIQTRKLTASINTLVSLQDDVPEVVGGMSGSDAATETVVIATARWTRGAPTPDQVSAGPSPDQVRVVRLRNADAEEMAELIGSVIGDMGVRVSVDSRTNSLLVAGKGRVLSIVDALVQALDKDE